MKTPVLADILERRKNSFDLLRLLLASMVVVSHTVGMVTAEYLEPLELTTGYTLGAHAVHGFFVLSGIMVMGSWDRIQHIGHFLFARLVRVFPALICVTLTLALVIGPLLTTEPLNDYFSDSAFRLFFVKSLLMLTGSGTLPGVFEAIPPFDSIINSPIWTLKYEVLCYFLLGAAGVMGLWKHKKLAMLAVVAGLIVCFGWLLQNVPVHDHGLFDHLARFGFAFGLGVLAWHVKEKLALRAWPLVPLLAFAWVSVHTPFATPALILFTGYLVIFLGQFQFFSAAKFSQRYDLSYGTYIMGYPVMQTLFTVFPNIGLIPCTLLTLAITYSLAAVSWVLIERPALRMKTEQKKAQAAKLTA